MPRERSRASWFYRSLVGTLKDPLWLTIGACLLFASLRVYQGRFRPSLHWCTGTSAVQAKGGLGVSRLGSGGLRGAEDDRFSWKLGDRRSPQARH
jgi:hypothetical protein